MALNLTDEQKKQLLNITGASTAAIPKIDKAIETVANEAAEGDYKHATIELLTAEKEGLEETVNSLMKYLQKPDTSQALPEELIPDDAPAHEFRGLGDFMVKLATEGPNRENTSQELKKWREAVKATMSAGDAQTGGTLIPTEYVDRIMERAKTDNPILANATVIPMKTGKATIPFIDGFDESQGKIMGNGQFYWEGESEAFTETNPTFGTTELNLRKLAAQVRVTWELQKFSAISIEPILERMFNQGLSSALSRGFIRGTGVKMPKGILRSGGHKIEAPAATNQIADTYIYDNILDQIARHYTAGGDIGTGVFIANKTTLPQLGKLGISVGAGGHGIFLADHSIQDRPVFRLMGLPVRFDGQMPIVGDAGDITLADWQGGYLVGVPTGEAMETAQSIDLYFNYGDKAFRAITAMDGQPWWPSEYKPPYGDSQAPFVTIADR